MPVRLLSRLTPRSLLIGAVCVYAVAVPLLAGAGNGYFTILSLVPVITASLTYGRMQGILAASIFTPVNFALVYLIEGTVSSMLALGGFLGTLSLFGTASLVGSLQDIANRHLIRIVEEKDRLIGTISHELRTPLSTVVGLSHELADRFDDFTREEIIEFTGLIAEQSSELEALIEDLLVAARADIERVRVLSVPVDLRQIVDSLLSSGNNANVTVVPGDPVVARADGLRVRQIVRNLIENARRYGRDHIRVEISNHADRCSIAVVDNGDGVPEDKAESIFEPHVRAHRTNGLAESLGLGLYVSLTLAHLMGGALRYAREHGETYFILELPACAETVATAPQHA